jgi:hypothetical protein
MYICMKMFMVLVSSHPYNICAKAVDVSVVML